MVYLVTKNIFPPFLIFSAPINKLVVQSNFFYYFMDCWVSLKTRVVKKSIWMRNISKSGHTWIQRRYYVPSSLALCEIHHSKFWHKIRGFWNCCLFSYEDFEQRLLWLHIVVIHNFFWWGRSTLDEFDINVKMEQKYHHDFKDLEVFCCLSWCYCWIELTTGSFWHVYACTLRCLMIGWLH